MKKNFGKYIFSFILIVTLCVTVAVAATVSSTWSDTITDSNGIRYHGMTSAISSGTLVRSTASTVTVDGTSVPAGYAQAAAQLYRGSALAAETDLTYNTTITTGVTATTPQAGGSGNYKGTGTAGCWNGDGHYNQVTIPITPILQVGSRSVDNALMLESLPEEDKIIYTNEAGETYGSALASALSGTEYDLVSAIGIHGVQGYIRSTDRPKSAASPEEALARVPQDRYIPVYEADGKTIIDEFLIGSGIEN